ncbi:MAG: arsenate reductase ArsC [Gemmatimonadota bacterium]|nr:arsenate reductase ArsC [Gemmatimonadota bacterium]
MTTNILILCTHNSARSVLAEGMLNHWAARLGVDVRAYSAGSAPSGRVNPLALAALAGAGIDTTGMHSKSWDRFAEADAPAMRIVLTVCDSAAAEACPVWPGSPVRVHWGYPDPSRAEGDEATRLAAFEVTRAAIGYRVLRLLALPLATMTDEALRAALTEIGGE